jgi:hypothetical protein
MTKITQLNKLFIFKFPQVHSDADTRPAAMAILQEKIYATSD